MLLGSVFSLNWPPPATKLHHHQHIMPHPPHPLRRGQRNIFPARNHGVVMVIIIRPGVLGDRHKGTRGDMRDGQDLKGRRGGATLGVQKVGLGNDHHPRCVVAYVSIVRMRIM